MSNLSEGMSAEDKKAYVIFMRELYEGKHPYVVYMEQRQAVMKEVFEELELKQGETISPEIWTLILEAQLNQIQAKREKLALEEAKPSDFEDTK